MESQILIHMHLVTYSLSLNCGQEIIAHFSEQKHKIWDCRCNISNTRYSVSSGYPDAKERVENAMCSRVFLRKFEVFG